MWPDRALHHVGVHLDAAVVEEGDQARPVPQRVAHRLGQIRRARDAIDMLPQPDMQRVHDRPTSLLPDPLPMIGGMAADLSFDRVERRDAGQHFGRQRRLCRSMELEELAPHMRPAERQPHRSVGTIARQPLEPGIAVDLQHAREASQVHGGALPLPVFGIDIGGRRMRRTAPRPVVDGIAPQPAGLGPAPTRVEHRQCRVVGEQFLRRQHRAEHQLVERRQPPAGAANPIAQRRAINRDPLPRQHLRLPVER